eukprot:6459212-Amphidinium_carterae.1
MDAVVVSESLFVSSLRVLLFAGAQESDMTILYVTALPLPPPTSSTATLHYVSAETQCGHNAVAKDCKRAAWVWAGRECNKAKPSLI